MNHPHLADHPHDSRIVLAGVEHEYSVHRRGRAVDFREVIHRLPMPGRRIDPGDPHAYRTTSGVKITCDGPEAEIATPPLPLGRGVFDDLSNWTEHGNTALDALTGHGLTIEGVSTHISISVDNELAPRAAGMFARTFAPALMLLMDSSDSPGLLVRPRHGRLEFGGEFVAGPNLRAALALAVGGALACEEAARSFASKALLSPPLRVDVVRSVDRYGWYVARDAFGVDLYSAGRKGRLRRELVGSMTVQQMLDNAWKSAGKMLTGLVDETDLRPADDAVSGALLLPTEAEVGQAPTSSIPLSGDTSERGGSGDRATKAPVTESTSMRSAGRCGKSKHRPSGCLPSSPRGTSSSSPRTPIRPCSHRSPRQTCPASSKLPNTGTTTSGSRRSLPTRPHTGFSLNTARRSNSPCGTPWNSDLGLRPPNAEGTVSSDFSDRNPPRRRRRPRDSRSPDQASASVEHRYRRRI